MKNRDAFLIQQLQKPGKPVDVVLDTDTFNEIDDQYALSYLVRSTEKLNTLAVYAAPFSNEKAATPLEGMEKSYDEILRILSLCGNKDLCNQVFKGSPAYLPDEKTPVDSPAAQDLIEKAMAHSPENPLYVVAIGAITNVASALLMKPEIADRIVVVWLGGNAHFWPQNSEFNMAQDIAAARIIFNSAPLVQLPCMGVVTHLTTTEPELRHHLKGKSALGDYLYDITCHEVTSYNAGNCWSRVIWDVAAIAWLLDEGFMKDSLIQAPSPSYDNGYVLNERGHFIKVVYWINRDAIFADLFTKLAR